MTFMLFDPYGRIIEKPPTKPSTEMIGAVRGIDPETGQYFDDTKRYVDASALPEADKQKILEGNARKVYPRINKALSVSGRQ